MPKPETMTPLEQPAMSVSVSYRAIMPPEALAEALASGAVVPPWGLHISEFIGETSLPLFTRVFDQVHAERGVSLEALHAHLRSLSEILEVKKPRWCTTPTNGCC